MRTIMEEVMIDIRDNPFLSAIMALQLAVFTVICLFSAQFERELKGFSDGAVYSHQDKEIYRLVDNLVGQYETEFFQNSDSMARLKIMYSKLKNNPQFEYLEMYDNPIVLISDRIPDEVLYTYEDGGGDTHRGEEDGGEIFNEVKCFWMSRNVADLFQLQCEQGEFWREENKNASPIPLVLGSQYKDIFAVGDVIEGLSPVSPRGEFEVTGILKKGAYLVYQGQVLSLDRYVLMPMQDGSDVIMPNERAQQRFLYLFKINGALYSDLSANELQTLIQDICESSGVSPVSSVEGATNQQSKLVEMNMQDVSRILKKMVTLLYVFSAVATILFMIMKIDKNNRYYSILLLNGFSYKQVMSIIMGSLVLLMVLSETMAILLYCFVTTVLWEGAALSLFTIVIHDIGLIGTIGMMSFWKLKKLDVQSYIGGAE